MSNNKNKRFLINGVDSTMWNLKSNPIGMELANFERQTQLVALS